jgi:tetratricopeptide (TPR) repeat protein
MLAPGGGTARSAPRPSHWTFPAAGCDTSGMARWAILLMAAGLLAAEEKPALKTQRPAPAAQAAEQEPPEEDEMVATRKEYSFNPLQATKEIQIGNFYFKKGSYRAAAQRFREATRWNANDAEAWLRLAETGEKLKDAKGAKEAYTKYLELSPDAKNAAQLRKKIGKK